MKTKPQYWQLPAAFTGVIGCLLLTACVSGRSGFQKVIDPNMLYEFPDFAVRSPPGGDWLLMRTEPRLDLHGIRFYKDFHPTHFPATHSFYVFAQSESATNTFADQKDFLALAQQQCAQGNWPVLREIPQYGAGLWRARWWSRFGHGNGRVYVLSSKRKQPVGLDRLFRTRPVR